MSDQGPQKSGLSLLSKVALGMLAFITDKKNDEYKKYIPYSIVTSMLLFTAIAIIFGITSNDVYIFAKYAEIVVIYSLIFGAPLLLYKSIPISNIFSRTEIWPFLKHKSGYILAFVSMILLIFILQKVLNSKKKNKDNENKTAANALLSAVLIVNFGLITLLLLPPTHHIVRPIGNILFPIFGISNIVVSSIIPTTISNTSHIR